MGTVVYHEKMKQRCAFCSGAKAQNVLKDFLRNHNECHSDITISFSEVNLNMGIKITISGVTKKSLKGLTTALKNVFPKQKVTLVSDAERHLYRIA